MAQGGMDMGAGARHRRLRGALLTLFLAALALLALPFVLHSLRLARDGLHGALAEPSHLFPPDAPLAAALMGLHMLGGALLTALAPVQVLPWLRRRWPPAHRWLGRALAAIAGATALAGLAYIGLRGTVGGPWMDLAFAGYGLCLLVAAVQAPRAARAGDFARHREWALRLFVLAMGSFLYRLHYGLWYLATDGLASAEDFTGLFDRITLFAFYLPYLLVLEVWLRLRPPPVPRPAR
jgi:uncharacterized membrane protein